MVHEYKDYVYTIMYYVCNIVFMMLSLGLPFL